ncbi:2-amino-4-hydroxy-6-hydroxymethyldihydropteridine diphosphokinase [Moraxella marmotae]|uniref:2-amino-4-hydroxy-6- hydroxymethyldihydropteridine diphosphokinase n=1 Tax=Moraxella marmotae TaxID=3344520 RepID=UPI0035F2448A
MTSKNSKDIQAVVLALGSNYQADAAFGVALEQLATLGVICLSDKNVAQDFTGRSRRLYHNACAYLLLNQATDYQTLNEQCKAIERLCGRDNAKKTAEFDYQVAMDIDILAVYAQGLWKINTARLPLKAHDIAGVAQVAAFLLADDLSGDLPDELS